MAYPAPSADPAPDAPGKSLRGSRFAFLRRIGRGLGTWWDHDGPRLGAAVSYYAIFALAPTLVIAISVAGAVFGADAARGHVVTQLGGLVGDAAAGEHRGDDRLGVAQQRQRHRGAARGGNAARRLDRCVRRAALRAQQDVRRRAERDGARRPGAGAHDGGRDGPGLRLPADHLVDDQRRARRARQVAVGTLSGGAGRALRARCRDLDDRARLRVRPDPARAAEPAAVVARQHHRCSRQRRVLLARQAPGGAVSGARRRGHELRCCRLVRRGDLLGVLLDAGAADRRCHRPAVRSRIALAKDRPRRPCPPLRSSTRLHRQRRRASTSAHEKRPGVTGALSCHGTTLLVGLRTGPAHRVARGRAAARALRAALAGAGRAAHAGGARARASAHRARAAR